MLLSKIFTQSIFVTIFMALSIGCTLESNWKIRASMATATGVAGIAGWSVWKQSKSDDITMQKFTNDKPSYLQRGDYKYGKYVQFNFDEKGLIGALAAGGLARTLVSVAMCGNKFETFMTTVLRPGMVKSLLFWIPSLVAYRMIVRDRETEDSEQENEGLKKDNENLQKRVKALEEAQKSRFSPSVSDPFGQYSHVHSLDNKKKD